MRFMSCLERSGQASCQQRPTVVELTGEDGEPLVVLVAGLQRHIVAQAVPCTQPYRVGIVAPGSGSSAGRDGVSVSVHAPAQTSGGGQFPRELMGEVEVRAVGPIEAAVTEGRFGDAP